MDPIVKGAADTVTATLKQGGVPYPIPSGAVITAQFTSVDGATVLVAPITLVSTTPGSNWPAGAIAVPLSIAQTNALTIGDVLMRVVYGAVVWVIPAEVIATAGGQSAIFTMTSAVAELRANQLTRVSAYVSAATLSDEYIWEKLVAAEGQAQRILRCYLAPTLILPDDAPQAEVDALDAAGTRYAQEAAYDYDADFFSADKWGYIVAKQKPLISVQSIKFAYPTPIGQVFELPAEWIRADKKYAHIRIVPTAMSASVPMAAFIMQSISGGRSIPFMIHLRYTAGIRDVRVEYPDLVSAIKRMAVLNILKDSFTPQSGSISADGLSQSMSADLDKFQDSVDKSLEAVRDAVHGVRFGVF